MLNVFRRALRRGQEQPVEGFVFDRPLVVLQSDDWGRVGIRDREGWEELQSAGLHLGERNYDFYSLETAEDVEAVASLLSRHRDSTGRPACLELNFMTANLDFAKMKSDDFCRIHLRPLSEGLPDGWSRPGLFEACRRGIAAGVFSPALHGTTHFCRAAAERHITEAGERGTLLRTLWKAGVPYIHWRMPWIGFEYSDPGKNGREAFLNEETQEAMIAGAAETFSKVFSQDPRSACAPGYRANKSTHRAWARHGIVVAQNGPGSGLPPHFEAIPDSVDESNSILHLYRTADFEPAAAPDFSLDHCMRIVENSLAQGLPAIISVHSINFHSTLKDFRSRTLRLLDELLSGLESKYPDLLYVRDQDIYALVNKGEFRSAGAAMRVQVTKRMFSPAAFAGMGKA